MRQHQGRASVVGLGLIGGSIALALKQADWYVTGSDLDEGAVQTAIDRGIIDREGIDEESDIVFIATPVGAVEDAVRRALNSTDCPITDVGSVKEPIALLLSDITRFVPGHPMAGNEFSKLDGADPSMFRGATWILTPTDQTLEAAYARVHNVVTAVLGAKVVSMEAKRHDELLAAVSHVPHLTSAAIMQTAATAAGPYASTMYALAAGGFRDMTRISSGDPDMWVDVALQNKEGIVGVLSSLIQTLSHVQRIVQDGDSNVLRQVLLEAQYSRRNLPARVIAKYSEIRIPVEDRVGVLKEVTNLATDLDVNIFDFEIAHSAEGEKGSLVLVVEDKAADRLFGGLRARNFKPQLSRVGPSDSSPAN